MILRILWLKEYKQETWKLVDMLLDHLDESKEDDKIMKEVVDFIHNHCKLTQFTEQEIRHVKGKPLFRTTIS